MCNISSGHLLRHLATDFLSRLLLLILQFTYLVDESLLLQVPIFPVLLKLTLQLLFFGVLVPIDLRFRNARNNLVFITDLLDDCIQPSAATSQFVLGNSLLLPHIFFGL